MTCPQFLVKPLINLPIPFLNISPFLHKLEFAIIEKLQRLGAKTRPGYRTTVIKVQKSEKILSTDP